MATKRHWSARALLVGCLGLWLRTPGFVPGVLRWWRPTHRSFAGPLLCSDTTHDCVKNEASELRAETGMLVQVDYNLTLPDGEQVAAGPLEFVCGEGLALKGLDSGVLGMAIGENRVLQLEPEDAFGLYEPEKTIVMSLEELPSGCEVGWQLKIDGPRGEDLFAKVISMGEGKVTLDYNHPLAGLPVVLAVELKSCAPAPDRSKLVIETISPGDGHTYPQPGSHVTVHYVGSLADGSVTFDSTRDHGEPFSFQLGVGQVIRGWDDGIAAMTLGERALLRVPAELGYGERGFADVIPPNANLVFDVELLSIE